MTSKSNTFMPELRRRAQPHYIGGENDFMWKTLNSFFDSSDTTKYPRYNIIKINDSEFKIEIAVAGFAKENLEVSLENSVLSISGNTESDEEVEYLHRGVSYRNFTKKFTLSDEIVVKSVTYVNGMLQIALERVIPEEKKPKRIPIE